MIWSAVGNWVVILKEQSTSNGIFQMRDNIGKVVSCACNPELVGKIVIFKNYNQIMSHRDHIFVLYEEVMGIEEGGSQ